MFTTKKTYVYYIPALSLSQDLPNRFSSALRVKYSKSDISQVQNLKRGLFQKGGLLCVDKLKNTFPIYFFVIQIFRGHCEDSIFAKFLRSQLISNVPIRCDGWPHIRLDPNNELRTFFPEFDKPPRSKAIFVVFDNVRL